MLPEVFVEALTSKGVALMVRGRLAEARICSRLRARGHTPSSCSRARCGAKNNLAVVLESLDLLAEALDLCDRSAALARRRGDRRWESNLRTGGLIELFQLGRWDEAVAVAAEEAPLVTNELTMGSLLSVALVHCERGEVDVARDVLGAGEGIRASANPQGLAGFAAVEARDLAGGRTARRGACGSEARACGARRAVDHRCDDQGLPGRGRYGGAGRSATSRRQRLCCRSRTRSIRATSLPSCKRVPLDFMHASTPHAGVGRESGSASAAPPGCFASSASSSTSRSRSSSTASGSLARVAIRKPSRCSPRRAKRSNGSRATPWLERLDAAGMRPVQSATP